MPQTIRGELRGDGLRVVVLVARWNPEITARLLAGALDVLDASGVDDEDVRVVEVPGCFELPQAAAFVVERDEDVDAIVALGCLVKGETPHDRILADAVAAGLLEVARRATIPVAFGVITADTIGQAEARSGGADVGGDDAPAPGARTRPARSHAAPDAAGERGAPGNKGREAADAAVRLADAYRRYEEDLS